MFFIWMFAAKISRLSMVTATATNTFVSLVGGIAGSICIICFSLYLEKKIMHHKLITRVISFIGAQSLVVLCFHLIDLDNIQIWGHLTNYLGGFLPYSVVLVIGIIYRITFALLSSYLISFIPGLRSVFMPRKFPAFRKYFS